MPRKGPAPKGYRSWAAMVRRCENPNHDAYPYYGGRGIKVDPRIRKYVDFIREIGPPTSEAHQVDRIDPNKNYEPGNLRWATAKEQLRNKRNMVYVEYEGQSVKLCELCETLGADYKLVLSRFRRGEDIHEAVKPPIHRKCSIRGIVYETVAEAAKAEGLKPERVSNLLTGKCKRIARIGESSISLSKTKGYEPPSGWFTTEDIKWV